MLLVLIAALLAPWGSQAYPLVGDGTVACPAPTLYLGSDGGPLDPNSLIEPSLSFLASSGLDAQCLDAIVGGLPVCIQDIIIKDGCCSAGCATALNTFISLEIAKMLRPMHFNALMRCVTGTLLSCAEVYPGPPPPPPSPGETSEHSHEHSDEHSDHDHDHDHEHDHDHVHLHEESDEHSHEESDKHSH
ncbi:hypothetical protein QJQ45_018061 [Haematococcus lacustris]|nr:hypothetical protein QJQ45_018061 [Haematococcus lacustris]